MKIKTGKEAQYAEAKGRERGWYGPACYRWAEEWASLMEAAIAEGKTIPEVAKDLSYKVFKGASLFQYGMAVSILAEFWEHGEELRRWHNLKEQFGNEGERANESGGVLNPAVISFGVGSEE